MNAQDFIHSRIIQKAESFPLCLAVGNPSENLDALKRMDEPPQEPVTRKIWTLLKSGGIYLDDP